MNLLSILVRFYRPLFSDPFVDRVNTLTGQLIDDFLKGDVKLDWRAASFLLAANLYELVPRIEKTIEEGKWVIFDRYTYSSVAYSIARGLDPEIAELMTSLLPEPDIVLFLSIHEDGAAERQDFGKEIFEKTEFQAKVRKGFAEIKKPKGWTHLDVDGQSIDQVHAQILDKTIKQ